MSMLITNFITELKIPDFIQLAILVGLIWYSIETHFLRKWQKKQLQLAILSLDMQRIRDSIELPGNTTPYGEKFPIIIRKIYELGKFDLKFLYCEGFRGPISVSQKIMARFNNKIHKN